MQPAEKYNITPKDMQWDLTGLKIKILGKIRIDILTTERQNIDWIELIEMADGR